MSPETKTSPAHKRLRTMVDEAVAVLDEEKAGAAAPGTTPGPEPARSSLLRNRRYGDLPLGEIRPDPQQVRKAQTKSPSFRELLASVREHGVLEPITVRWVPEKRHYQIITGERRYLAARRARLSTIPVIVKDVDDTTKAIHQLVENLQREDMNPVQEAKAFQRYLAATKKSQEELARRIGKSKAYVSQMLGLLRRLSLAEQEQLAQVSPAKLPGKSLILEALRIEDSETRQAILSGRYTRQEARQAVSRHQKKRAPGRPRQALVRYAIPEPQATVTVRFSKSRASGEEVVTALRAAARQAVKELREEGSS